MKSLVFLLLLAAASGSVWAQPSGSPVPVWSAHRLLIPIATRVDLSHLGVHTHADEILFQISQEDVAALQANPRVRNVRLIAHCRLPTSGSALPPGFSWLAKDYGAIPSDGPIDGSPGWALAAVPKGPGRSVVRVSVPTRFANWVAGQTAAKQRRYKSQGNYSLEIRWEQQAGG